MAVLGRGWRTALWRFSTVLQPVQNRWNSFCLFLFCISYLGFLEMCTLYLSFLIQQMLTEHIEWLWMFIFLWDKRAMVAVTYCMILFELNIITFACVCLEFLFLFVANLVLANGSQLLQLGFQHKYNTCYPCWRCCNVST